LEGEADGYYSSGKIAGSKHFGVWPLSPGCSPRTDWSSASPTLRHCT